MKVAYPEALPFLEPRSYFRQCHPVLRISTFSPRFYLHVEGPRRLNHKVYNDPSIPYFSGQRESPFDNNNHTSQPTKLYKHPNLRVHLPQGSLAHLPCNMHRAITKVTLPEGQDNCFLCTETAGDTPFAQFYRFLRKLESSLVRP
jgi:hypothetical protein